MNLHSRASADNGNKTHQDGSIGLWGFSFIWWCKNESNGNESNGIAGTGGSVSGGSQQEKSNTVGNVGHMGLLDCGVSHSNVGQQMNFAGVGTCRILENVCSASIVTKQPVGDYPSFGSSLVDPAGDSAMRNSDLIGRMEYSGSSLCQARKRALDSRLITNSTEATRGHLSIHVVSATSSCATSSSKRRRVDIYHHNGNSSSLGARPMSTNDRPSTPIRTSIPLNGSTGHIDRSGPPSEYQYINSCDHWCQHCGAGFWYEERIKDNPRNARPKFHRCCMVDSKNLLDKVFNCTSLFKLPERLKANNTIRVNQISQVTYRTAILILTLEGFFIRHCEMLKSTTLNVLARSQG
ncbi:hypothetical protein Tco_0664812 [Tanacetum coccineum]